MMNQYSFGSFRGWDWPGESFIFFTKDQGEDLNVKISNIIDSLVNWGKLKLMDLGLFSIEILSKSSALENGL